MKKAVIYTRVSSREQKEEGFSLEAQEKLLVDYAHKNNLKIIKHFQDVETAKQSGRVQFSNMLSYIKQGTINHLLVEKTDRLYRNLKDYIILEEFPIEIHLVKENETLSKNSNSHSKLIHGFKVLMAKNYVENLSEEIKKGLTTKARKGIYPIKAPFGYKNNKEKKDITVHEKEALIVKRIFKMYATATYSLEELAFSLFKEGVKMKRSSKIWSSSLKVILSNTFYIGFFKWRGELIQGSHEAIVDKDIFELCQKLLSQKSKKTRKKRHYHLGQFLKSTSGYAYTGNKKDNTNHTYYSIPRSRYLHKGRYLREDYLFRRIDEYMQGFTWNKEFLKHIKKISKDIVKKEKKEKFEARKRIEKIKLQKEKLLNIFLENLITKEEYTKKIFELELELSSLSNIDLQNLDVEFQRNVDLVLETFEKIDEIYQESDWKEKSDILKCIFYEILIDDTKDDISLQFKAKEPFSFFIESDLFKMRKNETSESFQFHTLLFR